MSREIIQRAGNNDADIAERIWWEEEMAAGTVGGQAGSQAGWLAGSTEKYNGLSFAASCSGEFPGRARVALSRDYRELFLGNQVKLLISTYMVHGRLEFLARGDPEKVLRALLSGSRGLNCERNIIARAPTYASSRRIMLTKWRRTSGRGDYTELSSEPKVGREKERWRREKKKPGAEEKKRSRGRGDT